MLVLATDDDDIHLPDIIGKLVVQAHDENRKSNGSGLRIEQGTRRVLKTRAKKDIS
jgi:hypothetical protein